MNKNLVSRQIRAQEELRKSQQATQPEPQEQEQPKPQEKFINLADMPDGKYTLVDEEKVAVKVGDTLNIFDVFTFVGSDGAKIKAGLLVKQVKLRKERREVTQGVVMSGDVVSFRG